MLGSIECLQPLDFVTLKLVGLVRGFVLCIDLEYEYVGRWRRAAYFIKSNHDNALYCSSLSILSVSLHQPFLHD